MSFFLFILYFVCCQTAKPIPCTNQLTNAYNTIKNDIKSYVQLNTFGGNFPNKCDGLRINYKSKYLVELSSNLIRCSGHLCKNGFFECTNSNECYHVEHIVDKENTPYNQCNPNILGNVIMAYGVWNVEVGQKCWDDVVIEKFSVYGKESFCQSVRNVIECSGCNVQLPAQCLENEIIKNPIFITIFIILLIVIIGSIVFGLVQSKEKIKTSDSDSEGDAIKVRELLDFDFEED